MNCEEMSPLLGAYLDGELDLVTSMQAEAHVAECAACQAALEKLTALNAALTENAPRYAAPEGLRARVRTIMKQESGNEIQEPVKGPLPAAMSADAWAALQKSGHIPRIRQDSTQVDALKNRRDFPQDLFAATDDDFSNSSSPTLYQVGNRRPVSFWPLALAAAILAAIFLMRIIDISTLAPRAPGSNAAGQLIVQEAVSNHVRSLLVTHLTDVVSTDQHTVKPWFTGKLDYSPPVVNLTEAGFPLIGGRLDFLDNRPVSAIVYQRRKHIINLFIWPAGPNEMLPETYDTGKGFHIRAWRNGQMNYMAVSEVAEADLAEFCGLIQAQTK